METDERGRHQEFFIAPVVATPEDAVALGLQPAVLKLTGEPALAELLADGSVREYHIRVGWGAAVWSGFWSHHDGAPYLRIGIGTQYEWVGVSHVAPGYLRGSELNRATGEVWDYPAVLIAIDPDQTRYPMADVPDHDEPLFSYGGYEFYLPERDWHGAFGRVLEARTRTATGHVERFAAKCSATEPPRVSWRLSIPGG